MPNQKQKEFVSVVGSSLKSFAYYQQHPEEKQEFLTKLRGLFEDWKKARKESDDYHEWRKGRELSPDEMDKDYELSKTATRKMTEFFNQSLYYPGLEVRELFLEAKKINSGDNSVSDKRA